MRLMSGSMWIFHGAFLATMFLWIGLDPSFDLMIERLRANSTSPTAAFHDAAAYVGWLRVELFATVLLGGMISYGWLLVGMLRRSASSRQLRSLRAALALIAISSLWCGLTVNASSLTWQSKRIRLAWQIDKFEKIVQPLRSEWPGNDGELPGLGPFMAYPLGDPSTLIMLQPPSVSQGGLYISAIDRDESGAIRLQLSGVRTEDWGWNGIRATAILNHLPAGYAIDTN